MSTTIQRQSTRKRARIDRSAAKINSLPVEILTAIFTFVAFPLTRRASFKYKYPQFRLSWVCRYWRFIILENPRFWTCIDFSWMKKDLSECTEELIRRSGASELVVFGPQYGDPPYHAAMSFDNLLWNEARRIKVLSLAHGYVIFSAASLDFKNLQDLTLTHGLMNTTIDILSTAKNLRALKLILKYGSRLLDIILQLSPSLKKLSLVVLSGDGVPEIFSRFKTLEYLSVELERSRLSYHSMQHLPSPMTLPDLKTLKMNIFGSVIDQLSAPALKSLSILSVPGGDQIKNDYGLLDSFNLSAFTHLYIGYKNPSESSHLDGCIWATVGSTIIPCLQDPPAPEPEDIESLIHIHPYTDTMYSTNVRIPCKLISRMTSLDTLVLSLPRLPRFYHILDPAPAPYSLNSILSEVTRSSPSLRHLIIRGDYVRIEDIETLSKSLSENFTSNDSCPLLQRITFSSYNLNTGTVKGKVLGDLWVNFLTLRKTAGCSPLEYVQLEGCPSVSRRLSQRMKELDTVLIQIRPIEGPGCAYVHNPGF